MAVTRWRSLLYISVMFIFLSDITTAISTKFSGPSALNLNLPLTTKELRRLKAKGLEVVPSAEGSITSNSVTSEPTCEELRAMWRYYKRQSRAAELTNQIPQIQLPDLFWDMPPAQYPSSFGPLRARNRPRFRMNKGPSKAALYGRVLMSPPKETNNNGAGRRLPVEEVVRELGPTTNNRNLLNNNDRVSEPTLHFSPPVEPTPESGFQKLKDMYRQERVKEQHKSAAEAQDNSGGPPLVNMNKDFGRIVLTPPIGQDGRVANKPKELMSPFEKLRFHSEDVLGIGDEIDRRHSMMSSFMSKRRNGFIGIPMLNPKNRNGGMDSRPPPKPKSASTTRNNFKGNEYMESKPSNLDMTSDMRDPFVLSSSPERNILGDDARFDETLISIGDYNLDSSEDARKYQVDIILPCSQVESQVCSSNLDCSCVGYGLYRCFMNQCQVLSIVSNEAGDWITGAANDVGFWHPGALGDKHLGAWEQSSFPKSSRRLESEEKKEKVSSTTFEKSSPPP